MGRREKDGQVSILRAERRQHSKQTLSEFAREIGYSPSYLSAVELGYLPVTPEVTFAYESALGIKAGSLIPGKVTVGRMLHGITRESHRPADSSFTMRTLSGEGKLALYPRRDVLRSMVSLMMESSQRSKGRGEIYVTSQGVSDDFDQHPKLKEEWDFAMRAALSRGWHINQLFRLGEDQQRSLDVIESLFGVLGAPGSYVPWRMEAAETPSYDLVVIPSVGALLRIDTPNSDQDLALLTRDGPEINALAEHCRSLMANATQFIRRIDRDDVLEFERLLAQMAETPGDTLLVREGLSNFVSTSGTEEDYAFRRGAGRLTPAEVKELADIRRNVVSTSRAQLLRYPHRHISTKKSVLELLEVDPAHCRELIASMLRELRSYDGLELALLDDSEVRLLQPAEDQSVVYWLVKEGSTTLLETWPVTSDAGVMHIHVAINSQAVAGAFASHFRNLWNRISPRNRDKSYVIWWLERLIES